MGQEKYGENAEEYCDGSFDEEDERPSLVILGMNFGKTCSKKSTKRTRPMKLAHFDRHYMDHRSSVLTMEPHNKRDRS